MVDLPGTVRPQPGLLAFLQGHVKQWGGSIADVHAGTIQQLCGQRREQPGALLLEAGQGRRGRAVRIDLDHAGRSPGGRATDPAAFEDHHGRSGLRQLIGDRGADGPRTNNDDVRAHTPDLNLSWNAAQSMRRRSRRSSLARASW